MPENGRERIGYGSNDALGLLLRVESKTPMNARDDEVEARKHFVGIVQGAIGENVALDAFKGAEAPGIVPVQAVDFGVLRSNVIKLESACIVRGLRMIGDPEILIASVARRRMSNGC